MSENTDESREDAKTKMREALDRKKQNEHGNADGRRNSGAVHGSQVAPGEGRRVFRRKSG